MRGSLLDRLGQGASAGALATLPMTGVMLVAQRLGLMGQQPPARITDAALEAAGAAPPESGRRLWTAAAHVGFGAGMGALFAALRPGRPTVARALLDGAVFGSAVWAISYAGWVPALHLMPPPTRDRAGRPASMIVAHWVFGAALGAILARLRR